MPRLDSGEPPKGVAKHYLDAETINFGGAAENLQAAESQIRDTDMATQMVEYVKNNILMQSGTAMLAQANVKTQSVLQLLG